MKNVLIDVLSRSPGEHLLSLRRDRRKAAAWALWLLLPAICIYRILTFVPQPIDSSATLRPHLYHWIGGYLKHYPNADQAMASWNRTSFLLLLIPAVLAILNYILVSHPRDSRLWRILRSRTLFFTSIAAALVACRLPVLLVNELNADETQFMAAAQKLFIDPFYFRAVDCGTTGPFNIYPLMLPAIFGISPDYASGRLMGLLIILASVYTVYRTFCLLIEDHQARIAILPAAGIFAVFTHPDFLHYSSEHVSFLIVSLALFFCTRTLRQPDRHAVPLIVLGALTSVAFYAKMQAVPIAGALALIAAACVYRTANAGEWWRPPAMLAAGAIPIHLLNVVICLSLGVFKDFWMAYIAGNYSYGQVGAVSLGSFIDFVLGVPEIRLLIVTFLALVAVYIYQARSQPDSGHTQLYLRFTVVGGIAAIAADYLSRISSGTAAAPYALVFAIFAFGISLALLFGNDYAVLVPMRWFGLAITTFFFASLFAAYAPHRLFPHYLLLLFLPLSVIAAWPLLVRCNASGPQTAGSTELPFMLVFVTLTLTSLTFLGDLPHPIGFGDAPQTVLPPESYFIRSITQASDQIVVWGWNPKPYLGSARVAGTRDSNMVNLFSPSPEIRAFYRDRFLRDMKRTRPQLFVDATGPTSFGGDGGVFLRRDKGGFETIPEIRSYIEANYVQIAEAYGQRFYGRRDAPRGVVAAGQSTSCPAGAAHCFSASAGSTPATLPSIRMPEHAVLDVVFTPAAEQERYVTVFSNDVGVDQHMGFQFHYVGNDEYQLVIGIGNDWVRSKPIGLPPNIPAALSIQFNGKTITILYNGIQWEEMQLPSRMADSDAPITIGSWIAGQRAIAGKVLFFHIRDSDLSDSNR